MNVYLPTGNLKQLVFPIPCPFCVQFSITQYLPGLYSKNLSRFPVITKSKSKNNTSPSKSDNGYCQILIFLQGVIDICSGRLILGSGWQSICLSMSVLSSVKHINRV